MCASWCVSEVVSLCGSPFQTDLAVGQKSLISSQLAGGEMNALPLKDKAHWAVFGSKEAERRPVWRDSCFVHLSLFFDRVFQGLGEGGPIG